MLQVNFYAGPSRCPFDTSICQGSRWKKFPTLRNKLSKFQPEKPKMTPRIVNLQKSHHKNHPVIYHIKELLNVA